MHTGHKFHPDSPENLEPGDCEMRSRPRGRRPLGRQARAARAARRNTNDCRETITKREEMINE